MLEAEFDYILVRLIGSYDSDTFGSSTSKSRIGNDKYYLGEYMRADNSTWNSYNEPWPDLYKTSDGDHYYFGGNWDKVDNPKWSGKSSDSWTGSNSYSNYVKYDKYRYTDNKPLGTVLRIEPQGDAIPPIEIKSSTNSITYPDIGDIKNNKYFKDGGSITFTLNITENVKVTGTPKLKMNTKVLLASDVTTAFTNKLEFVYNVEKDDNFPHIYIPENPLILDAGVKIQDYALNELSELNPKLVHRQDFSGYIIDTTNPNLTGIEIKSNNSASYPDINDVKNNKYFKQGGSITFTLNISENVQVTGTPKLKMNTKFLDASSVSKDVFTNKLEFVYNVEKDDNFPHIYIPENPLVVDAGVKLQDYALNELNELNAKLARNDLSGYIIDTTNPTLTGIEIKSYTNSITYPDINDIKNNKYFKQGGSITFTLNISKNIQVTGTPKLKMNTKVLLASDATTKFTNKLEFVYNVEKDDNFPHIYIPENPLIVDAGVKIQDYALNELNAELARNDFSGYIIDATNPTLTGIEIKSYTNSITYQDINDIKNNKYFKQGGSITFTLNISENVQVTGTPKLKMNTKVLLASDVTTTFTNKLEFVYNVEKDDNFPHIYIPENPLIVDTDVKLQDYALNELNAKLVRLDFPDYIIDATNPTLTGIEIKSHNGTSYQDINDIKNNKYFKDGGSITFTLNISENVKVTGTPKLKMNTKVLLASDVTTTFTNKLEFVYNVEKDDNFPHIYIPENPLIVDTDVKFQDYALNELNELNAKLPRNDFSGYIIETKNPSLTGIEIKSYNNSITYPDINDIKNNKYFKQGGSITFTLNISENVQVTGTPKLKMNTKVLLASDVTTTFTNKLEFVYNVEKDDNFQNLYIPENPLIVDAGVKIQDYALNELNAQLSRNDFSGYIIDTTNPTLTGIEITSSNNGTRHLDKDDIKNNKYFKVGGSITFTINISENVKVTGIPKLKMNTKVLLASDVTTTFTNKLEFVYNVEDGDNFLNGIEIKDNPLILEGVVKIQDYANNDIALTFAKQNFPEYIVITTPPVLSNFTIRTSKEPTNDYYIINDIIYFDLDLNNIVTSQYFEPQASFTGFPSISFTIGTTKKYAIILPNGNYTNKLTFSYTIKEGDYDDNGISILKSAGKLIEYADPSTLITDLAGNPLNREYGSELKNDNFDVDNDGINPTVNYKIDAVRRVITDFKIEGSGNQYFNTYGVNSILSFTYTFNYPVKIMGSPKLQIQLKKLSSNGYELIDYNPQIDYHNGDGTNMITFQYKILQNDYADIGIAVPSNPFVIDETNKLISSVDGRDAILNPRNAVSSNSNFKINAIFPKITTISISGPSVNNPNTKKDINSGYFKEDNEIYITINFSREVVISPYTNCKLFILTDKYTTKKLAVQPYGGFVDSYGGAQDILIKINTAMGDAEGGLSIYRSPENQILFVESGTFITDRYGNPSTLTYTKDFTPYTKMPLYKILVTKPYLTSLNITPSGSTSNHPNIYPIGGIIEFKYTFSRVVYVTGNPVIQINIGTTSKTINYGQGSETQTLTFTYTIVENDIATDGIQLSTITDGTKSKLINGGLITDIVGNHAVLDKDENFYIGNSNS